MTRREREAFVSGVFSDQRKPAEEDADSDHREQ